MIEAEIMNPKHPEAGIVILWLPETEGNISKSLKEINLPEISTDHNCQIIKMSICSNEYPLMEGKLCNLDELNYLAKCIGRISDSETINFLAVAEALQADCAKDLINTALNYTCYDVVHNFEDLNKLGMYLYMKEKIAFPNSNPKKNYVEKAKTLLSTPPIGVTPHGVVYKNAKAPEIIYNGKQFPAMQFKPAVLGMKLINANTQAQEILYLPCISLMLDKALRRIGVQTLEECNIELEGYALPERICSLYLQSGNLKRNFELLNNLCRDIYMDRSQGIKIESLVNHSDISFEQIMTIRDNLSDFQFIPGVHNMKEYGEKMLHDSCPSIDSAALHYMDLEGYAQQYLQHSNGVFTKDGYLGYMGTDKQCMELMGLPPHERETSLLRLFSPLNATFYANTEYGESEEKLDGLYLIEYADRITQAIEKYSEMDHRGLALYLDSPQLQGKVYSMKPAVEPYDGQLYGVLECQLLAPLTEHEYQVLCEEWTGQASDGWGEGFEQHKIEIWEGELYIHFWESNPSWKIQTEDELKGEQFLQIGGLNQ